MTVLFFSLDTLEASKIISKLTVMNTDRPDEKQPVPDNLESVIKRVSEKRANELLQWLKDKQDVDDLDGIKKLSENSLSLLVDSLTKSDAFPAAVPETLKHEFLPFVQKAPIQTQPQGGGGGANIEILSLVGAVLQVQFGGEKKLRFAPALQKKARELTGGLSTIRLLLTGERRSGKTTLLYEIIQVLLDDHEVFKKFLIIPVHWRSFFESIPNLCFPLFVEKWVAHLKKCLKANGHDISLVDAGVVELQQLLENSRGIVVIEEKECLSMWMQALDIINQIAHKLNKEVLWIADEFESTFWELSVQRDSKDVMMIVPLNTALRRIMAPGYYLIAGTDFVQLAFANWNISTTNVLRETQQFEGGRTISTQGIVSIQDFALEMAMSQEQAEHLEFRWQGNKLTVSDFEGLPGYLALLAASKDLWGQKDELVPLLDQIRKRWTQDIENIENINKFTRKMPNALVAFHHDLRLLCAPVISGEKRQNFQFLKDEVISVLSSQKQLSAVDYYLTGVVGEETRLWYSIRNMVLRVSLSSILRESIPNDLAFRVTTEIDSVNIGNDIDIIMREHFQTHKGKELTLPSGDILRVDNTDAFECKDGTASLQLNVIYHDAPNKKVKGFDFLSGQFHLGTKYIFYLENKLHFLTKAVLINKLNKFILNAYAASIAARLFSFKSAKLYAVVNNKEKLVNNAGDLFFAQSFFVRGVSHLLGEEYIPIKLHFFSPSGASVEVQRHFPCISFITRIAHMKPILGEFINPLFSNANVIGRYIRIVDGAGDPPLDDHDKEYCIVSVIKGSLPRLPCTVICLPTCLKSWFRIAVARYLNIKLDDLRLKQEDDSDVTDSFNFHLRKPRQLTALSSSISGYKRRREDEEVVIVSYKL